jgi:hypothetical protein
MCIIGADFVPADQPQDQQPAAPAAHRRGDGRTYRGPRKARGYEIGKGQFLPVEDAELEAIEIEGTHTIDIDSFVLRSEIDQRFFDTPYYITPTTRSGRTPLRSSARRCAARGWWRSGASCWPSASA